MSDYQLQQLQRSLSDVQSRISSLDDGLGKLTFGRNVRPGRRLILSACAAAVRIAGDELRAERFEKAAALPAMTSVAGWASELANAAAPNFILAIQRRSALAGILAKSPQVSLLGSSTQTVPVAGAAPAATVVIEGAPIPVRKGAFSPLTLSPFKLATIFTVTEELALSPGVEGALRSMLSQSVSDGMDAIAFAASGTGSIMTGAASVTASTATPLETAMRRDLEALLAALNGPSPDVVFVMAPSRALFASSVLPSSFAYSIAASTAINSTSVVAVDPAGIAAALAAEPKILVTPNAAVHEDDAPGALSVAGSPNVISAPLRSLFQADVLGMRVILHAGWMARSGAVAKCDSVTW